MSHIPRLDFIGRPTSYRFAVRGAEVVSGLLGVASRTVRGQRVELLRDLPYVSTGHPQQRLDVFVPEAASRGVRGAVVYFHGGAFQYLSRRTHTHIATRFALEGHVVFNVEYRLAPMNAYPACMEDASAALMWIARHADRFGVDPRRLLVAGESAGANIAVGVAVAGCVEQRSPWARRLFAEGPRLRGCIAACGVFCVDELDWRNSELARHPRVRKTFHGMQARYENPWNYSDLSVSPDRGVVRCLESPALHGRQLPELFAFAGSGDPVAEDTRRMVAAYRSRGAQVIARVYPGQRHAFHVIFPGSASRDVWRRQLAFAARRLR